MPNVMDPKYEYEVAGAIYPDPLTLFERDPDYQDTCFHNHRVAIGAVATMGLTRVAILYFKRRPIYSGLQRTALWILGGAIFGEVAQVYIDKYVNFRSQVHRHYIMLHPERFPPPKKEKVGEKWELWMPSRQ